MSTIIILPENKGDCHQTEANICAYVLAQTFGNAKIIHTESPAAPIATDAQLSAYCLLWMHFLFCAGQASLYQLTNLLVSLSTHTQHTAQQPLSPEAANGLLQQMLLDKQAIDLKNYAVCNKAHNIIAERYQSLTLETLSSTLALSSSYLSRTLVENAGCSFLDILHCRRLIAAAELMASKERTFSMEAIALQIGYANLNYFYRVFKRYTHATPASVCKAMRELDYQSFLHMKL